MNIPEFWKQETRKFWSDKYIQYVKTIPCGDMHLPRIGNQEPHTNAEWLHHFAMREAYKQIFPMPQ